MTKCLVFLFLRKEPAGDKTTCGTFGRVPVSEARGVGNICPQDKSSLAFMPRADAASRKYECPNGISCFFQVNDRFVEPHIDEVSNIFAKHETGLKFSNNSAHLRPEITGVCKTLFCSDCGKWLARETSRYEGENDILL